MKDRIKQIRKNLGMTQAQFGERIGVKGNTITNYEIGNRIPSNAIISSICREFHINEEWLRTGIGEPNVDEDISFGDVCSKIGVHDERARNLIMDYYKLSSEDKELLWKFIERFISK